MDFDLNTAIAVREREDGLLEKEAFDLSTAMPVENYIPNPPKVSKLLEKPNFILQTGDKIQGAINKLFTIPGQEKSIPEITIESLSNLNEPIYTGRVQIAKKEDIPEEQIPYIQPAPNRPGYYEYQKSIPVWEAALEYGAQAFVLGYAGVQGFKAVKTELGIRSLARDIAKSKVEFADTIIKVNSPESISKASQEIGATNKNFTNLREFLMQRYEQEAVKRLSAIEVSEAGKTQTMAESMIKDKSFSRLLTQELGVLNKALGETGEIPIARAKVGMTVQFGEGEKLLTGIIKEITGQRAIIEMDGRQIVATLSQLSLPEAPKVAEIKPTEAQGEAIEPKAISELPEEPVINLKNLKISEEAKANIENISSEIAPELEKVKGETLTYSEVLDAAKSSEILTKIIDRTQSKEVEAAILRTRQHLSALAEGKGVSEDFIKTLKIVKSFGTDTARKLGSLRIEAGSNEYNLKTKLVNDLTERGIEIDKIVKEAEGVDFNNQEQVTNFYRKFVKPKFWDLINEYRYINLLSSPKTHIVNAFSNLIQVSGLAPLTKILSGDIKGAKAYSQGAISSIGEASTKALEALKGKVFVERPDIPRLPTGSKVLKPFRYIPQALEASDVFFRTIAYEGELASQLAKGVSKGEAEEIAKEKASYFVFRKALDPKNKTGQGELLSAIDNLTSMIYKSRNIPVFGKAISWYIPFIQTPMNIAKQMIEYSPAGFTTLKGAKNKKEQLSKAYIGSLIFALAAYLVYKNDSTWSVPTGKKQKELFFAAGRQPFSIKIGDTWVGYSRLGPLALPIAIPAAIKYYAQDNPKSVTDTALQKQANVVGGIGEFFASMSYVEGVGQLMELVKNAPGALSKLAAGLPSQLIPLASLQRWINNFFIDPIYRKTDKEVSAEAIIDNARKSIIFATKGLPAYETPEGETSRRTYPGLNAFSPIPLSKSNKEYEAEYKDYVVEKKENLLDEKDNEGRRPRRRRNR
jgi:hypothetical protein